MAKERWTRKRSPAPDSIPTLLRGLREWRDFSRRAAALIAADLNRGEKLAVRKGVVDRLAVGVGTDDDLHAVGEPALSSVLKVAGVASGRVGKLPTIRAVREDRGDRKVIVKIKDSRPVFGAPIFCSMIPRRGRDSGPDIHRASRKK